MSVDFAPLKRISFSKLFDGRLKPFGIREHVRPGQTTKGNRCLTDGENFLWVFRNDNCGATFCRWVPNGNPVKIIDAIAKVFKTRIVSEFEPEYWGFDTEAEWNAALEVESRAHDKRLYQDVLKYISNERSGIKRGTLGENFAKIAKKLVAADPELLKPKNEDKLMRETKKAFGL